MYPPSVYELTIPRSHSTSSITKIVQSMFDPPFPRPKISSQRKVRSRRTGLLSVLLRVVKQLTKRGAGRPAADHPALCSDPVDWDSSSTYPVGPSGSGLDIVLVSGAGRTARLDSSWGRLP